jgi:hypothetical protein
MQLTNQPGVRLDNAQSTDYLTGEPTMTKTDALYQQSLTADLDMRTAMLSYITEAARQMRIEEAKQWAGTISTRYFMAVHSLSTARYEDVAKDVQRGKLSTEDADTILNKLAELQVLTPEHTAIYRQRIIRS